MRSEIERLSPDTVRLIDSKQHDSSTPGTLFLSALAGVQGPQAGQQPWQRLGAHVNDGEIAGHRAALNRGIALAGTSDGEQKIYKGHECDAIETVRCEFTEWPMRRTVYPFGTQGGGERARNQIVKPISIP